MGKIFKRVVAALIVCLLAFCAFLLVRLNQMVNTMGTEITSQIAQDSLPEGVEGQNSASIALFTMAAGKIMASGSNAVYDQSLTSLANTLLNDTLKTATISSIQIEEDGLLVTLVSQGIDPASLNTEFFANAVSQTAMEYISGNLLSLGSLLLQNNQQVLEEKVYAEFGPQLISRLEADISALPKTPTTSTYRLYTQADTWKLEPVDNAD